MVIATDAWRKDYSGSMMAVLVVENLINISFCEALEQKKQEIESELRALFQSTEAIREHFPIPIYSDYYKRYKKTYHVMKQIESIALKAKKIPSVAATVEAMFMAEVKNGLLTAGHDYGALSFPLILDVAKGEESYFGIGGKEHRTKPGDMMLSDQKGIISSIIYGPDDRTRIELETNKALFAIYAPAGISQAVVQAHFDDIYEFLQLASPQAQIMLTEFIK